MSRDDLTVLKLRPLAATAEAVRGEIMRNAGMLAPAATYRIGIDALLMREDVSVIDALDSTSLRLRQADAVLQMLEDGGPDVSVPLLAGLVRDLVRMALGNVRVISEGLTTAKAPA